MNITAQVGAQALKTKSTMLLLIIFVLMSAMLNMGMDRIESVVDGTGFYFSESFMFSSFWWLFVPIFYVQFRAAKGSIKALQYIALFIVSVVLHLVVFPALVWLISCLFYYHTFSYWQTFQFALPEHLFKLLLIYSLPLGCYVYFKRPAATIQLTEPQQAQAASSTFVSMLIVSEGNRKVCIEATDVLYISANSPYVNLHLKNKKYLHKETLKVICEKLENNRFSRIHKSVVVNVTAVHSYQSRKNGDYELIMTDGVRLRMSRNYALNFKEKIKAQHQVATD